jgi:predicted ribosome quality control (RQC) complex YloA/Tae2 family protein
MILKSDKFLTKIYVFRALGFKKFLGDISGGVKDAYDEYFENKRKENAVRDRIREEEAKRLEYEKSVNRSLDKFESPDFTSRM